MTMHETREAPFRDSHHVARARQALALLVEPDDAIREQHHRELFADDFAIEIPARGGCQVYSSLERGEFRSGTVDVIEAVESGPRVISHVQFHAVRQHEVDGVSVSQECSADGIVTFEFRGDLITRSWSMLRWR